MGVWLAPLSHLSKKGMFEWTVDTQSAFERLKQAMVTLPVLELPDFSKSFEIETDASRHGIGVVLQNK